MSEEIFDKHTAVMSIMKILNGDYLYNRKPSKTFTIETGIPVDTKKLITELKKEMKKSKSGEMNGTE